MMLGKAYLLGSLSYFGSIEQEIYNARFFFFFANFEKDGHHAAHLMPQERGASDDTNADSLACFIFRTYFFHVELEQSPIEVLFFSLF